MTDAEISKALALAIGYAPDDVWQKSLHSVVVRRRCGGVFTWHHFDYRDPTVIWPIAVRYNMMPRKVLRKGAFLYGRWYCRVGMERIYLDADTPEKVVAMAVIAHEAKDIATAMAVLKMQ